MLAIIFAISHSSTAPWLYAEFPATVLLFNCHLKCTDQRDSAPPLLRSVPSLLFSLISLTLPHLSDVGCHLHTVWRDRYVPLTSHLSSRCHGQQSSTVRMLLLVLYPAYL